MKVKIRGLVFVGFAAAVFAQSAFADDATDRKTVTSKYYVDTTFQTLTNEVGIGGTGQAATLDALKQTDDWSSNTKYPSMKVLSDAVGALDDVAGIHGDTNYIEVTEDANGKKVGIITNNLGTTADIYGNTNTGRLVTVGAVNGLLDTGISGTETNNTVPTSLAVQTYAEATANKLAETTRGTTTITQANAEGTDGNTKFPTVQNVYDFVKAEGGNYQRKLTSSEDALYIGKWDSTIGTSGDSTWKALEAVSSNGQASTDYVTIKADSNGVYQVNIPTAQIATTAALTGATATNDTGLVTAGSIRETILQAGNTAGGTIDATTGAVDTTVPTTKNVYEFVTNYAQDTYQPKVGVAGSYNSSAGASNIMIGYTVRSGSEGSYTYSSEWRPLNGQGYVAVVDDVETGPTVRLISEKVADAGADIAAATGITGSSDYNEDLTTARAVNEYVNSMLGNLTIPAMPTECVNAIAANNGHYCALVAGYSATTANHVGLEWTIMAPAN